MNNRLTLNPIQVAYMYLTTIMTTHSSEAVADLAYVGLKDILSRHPEEVRDVLEKLSNLIDVAMQKGLYAAPEDAPDPDADLMAMFEAAGIRVIRV